MTPERRKEQVDFAHGDRRRSYAEGEMPPNPTPGDPGGDSRGQSRIEQQRAAERERSESDTNSPGPAGT